MKDAEVLISFFLCFLFLFETHTGHVNMFQENPCEDFSIDGCTVDESMILETISDISRKDCQAVCSLVYKGNCNFFIYDLTTQKCEILSQELKGFIDSCNEISAPLFPDVQICLESIDPCKVSSYLNSFLTNIKSFINNRQDTQ